uniref:Lachesin n=1 Tax=Aceria tosichella TaxID=561515 RepID=A0A6G1SNJ7_9ACAR
MELCQIKLILRQHYTYHPKLLLLIILVYFIINLAKCQQNPSIVQITPGQTVDLGDTIDLSCSVQYGANYPIIWTKLSDNPNNAPLFISKDAALTVYDNRYSIRHDDSSSTYTLQVSKIQETDTGLYQCQVVTSATSRVTADTFISVRIPPLILDSSSRGMIVREGETFTLTCNATGVPLPKISWRRENNGLLPTGGVVAKGNTITIYNATKDDRGIYYCIADNQVGKPAKRSVGVEIEFAPQVGLVRPRYQQALGYPAELHCSVEASPTPDISWLKDGYQINSDNNFYQISSTSNSHDFIQSTLRIKKVGERDYGSYRCRAINKLGDRQNSMFLERAYEPVCPPACAEGEYLSITTSTGQARHSQPSFVLILVTCLLVPFVL